MEKSEILLQLSSLKTSAYYYYEILTAKINGTRSLNRINKEGTCMNKHIFKKKFVYFFY